MHDKITHMNRKKCRIFYDDGRSKIIMKLREDDAETWKLLIRPLIKEANKQLSKLPNIEDVGDEELQRIDDMILEKYMWKYFCFVPDVDHEDVSYFPIKRVEVL